MMEIEEADDEDNNNEMRLAAADQHQHHETSQPTSLLLSNLPNDAIDLVLSCLTLQDFARLSMLSKHLYQSVSLATHLHMSGNSRALVDRRTHPELPNNEEQGRKNHIVLPQDNLKLLLGRYNNLTSLHLERLAPIGDDLLTILNESPAASTLTSVSLNGCALSCWCVQSLHLPNLQHINLSGGSIRARISSLLKHSTNNLKSLGVTLCSRLRDVDVFDIGNLLYHTDLESLTLNQCIKLRRPTIEFPTLHRLNLVGCLGLSDLNRISCTRIVHLNLSFCIRLSGEQIERFLDRLPFLEELVAMRCSSVVSLKLNSKMLKRLNLNFCHELTELRLRCPSLVKLEVRKDCSCRPFFVFFFLLLQAIVTRFFSPCRYLPVMLKQIFSCSSLKILILDTVDCLDHLDLGGLSRLERLDIRAPTLSFLDLQGCRRLNHCQIECPALKDVKVLGSRTVALRFCRNVRQVLFKKWAWSVHAPIQ